MIEPDAAFVDIGPTDRNDPSTPRSMRYVPPGTEIHCWTPFEVEHPQCFVEENDEDSLRELVERTAPGLH